MPTVKEITDAIFGRKWREYYDQNSDGDRDYRTWPDVLFSAHATVYRMRAEQRLANAALLAAVAGDGHAAILARVDALADQIAQRATEDEQRDAEIKQLLQQHADGTTDAGAVLTRLGELILGAGPTDTPGNT